MGGDPWGLAGGDCMGGDPRGLAGGDCMWWRGLRGLSGVLWNVYTDTQV